MNGLVYTTARDRNDDNDFDMDRNIVASVCIVILNAVISVYMNMLIYVPTYFYIMPSPKLSP